MIRPLTKPRIEIHQRGVPTLCWRCRYEGVVGYGSTPGSAYRDWSEKRSRSRVAKMLPRYVVKMRD